MMTSPIKEDFLHYLWKTKKILPNQLQTIEGTSIDILDFGDYNVDAGPDFFNAKIKLNDTIWVGNIEMHVFSSDWKKHKHQNDSAYENVILHVVYEYDAEIKVIGREYAIPTVELKGSIPKLYLDIYLGLVQSNDTIPCQKMIKYVHQEKIEFWKYALMIERLEMKSVTVAKIFETKNNDWEETLYIMLARYFGSRVNTEPFEMLAKRLPLTIVHKNKDRRQTLEALFFGQAGMLSANFDDKYFLELKEEYKFQQSKYQLKPIDPVSWKFSKLRPMNFPTFRIAQFAGFMYKVSFLFSVIKEIENPKEIKQIFKTETSEYWVDHYRFGKASNIKSKSTSDDMIDLLLINAVAPVLFLNGKLNDDEKMIAKSIQILESIHSEKNNIISSWKSLGLLSRSAFDSQALIHLKTNYCNEYKCLNCKIGHEIMVSK